MSGKDFSHLKGKDRHAIAAMVVAGELSEADALAFGAERGKDQIAKAIEKAKQPAAA